MPTPCEIYIPVGGYLRPVQQCEQGEAGGFQLRGNTGSERTDARSNRSQDEIGGFQKVSLIDYPWRHQCRVFTQGCNFRCPFCHNRAGRSGAVRAVPGRRGKSSISCRSGGQMDGVSITGGEPTLQPDLAAFAARPERDGIPGEDRHQRLAIGCPEDLVERRWAISWPWTSGAP